MKYVKFRATMEPIEGVMEYDDEEYQDAVNSGELYYHGLEFLATEEQLKLTHELVDEPR